MKYLPMKLTHWEGIMMKRINITSLLFLVAFLAGGLLAEEKAEIIGWKKQLVGNLNISQTSFDNWTKGGENSLAWQLNLNGNFINNQSRWNLATDTKFTYGQSKINDLDSRKSIDEIRIGTVYTRKLGTHVNPYAALKFESQFAPGYKYKDTTKTEISAFMDPGYLTESIGAGWAPVPELKYRLGMALKQTFTNDFAAIYADDPTTVEIEKFKSEIGIESIIELNRKFWENILLTSRLDLFYNLKALNQTDVQWDTVISAKVAKFVNVNLDFKLLYDRDISARRQLKQALALGFTYSFM